MPSQKSFHHAELRVRLSSLITTGSETPHKLSHSAKDVLGFIFGVFAFHVHRCIPPCDSDGIE